MAEDNLPSTSALQPQEQNSNTMDVSLVFLNQIKQTYPNQPQVYLTFEKLVRAFLRQEIDGSTIANRVIALFNEHPDLIIGFSKYLPAICSSEQPMDALQELDHQRLKTALCFVNAVEKAYLGQPRIFSEFSKINLDSDLHPLVKLTKIRALFHDRPELVQTFQGFMPAGFAIDVDVYRISPPRTDGQNE